MSVYAPRGQQRVLDYHGTGLKMVVSCHVVAEIGTRVFCKGSECFELPSHLSSPCDIFITDPSFGDISLLIGEDHSSGWCSTLYNKEEGDCPGNLPGDSSPSGGLLNASSPVAGQCRC